MIIILLFTVSLENEQQLPQVVLLKYQRFSQNLSKVAITSTIK